MLGSLSNDNGDGNENGRRQKKNFARVSRVLYISLPSLPDYNVKLPIFTFCGGREHKTTIFFFFFWNSIHSFRIQLQKNSPLFAGLNEMEQAR